MVDRIIVKPDRVRGGGNIISPAKIVDDFSCFESSLVLSGGVFGLSYLPGQEIVVTLSASPSTVSVGSSVTFSATVTGDGDPLEGVTVSFKEGSTVIGTGETDSSGIATLVKSDLSVGSHSVVASYLTGVSSAVSVTVTDVPVPASVSLTGTKSILSYADSEQSVLTATVLDANDDPVEGVSVDLYKDSVLWDTISTGSSGTVSKTYSSAGVGDVSFTAEVGSLVSETYSIEDCIWVPKLDGTETITRLDGTVTASNGVLTGGSGYLSKGWDNSTDWELTCDVKITQNKTGALLIVPNTVTSRNSITQNLVQLSYPSDSKQVYCFSGGSIVYSGTLPYTTNTWYTVTVKKQGTSVTVEMNNNSVNFTYSALSNIPNVSCGVDMWQGGNNASMKNIKIKPL